MLTNNYRCLYQFTTRHYLPLQYVRRFSTTNYTIHIPDSSQTVMVNRPYQCVRGGTINQLTINYTRIGTRGKPIIYIMPSMSHSAYAANDYQHHTSATDSGWFQHVIGFGSEYGIDLNHYEILCAAALGAPFGTTSPLSPIDNKTDTLYRYTFPVITPTDQANVHAMLLDELGIKQVHTVIGASMGGMCALQFATHHTDRYEQCIAIACTAHTSPSTVALRSSQRSAVMLDDQWNNGNYALNNGPYNGMVLSRKIGTIAYRSRLEFDQRFSWQANSTTHQFEVEQYLDHVAQKFSRTYDANCYLVLSRCMDLMNIGYNTATYEDGCRKIPNSKQLMLLPVAQDSLIPAHELTRLASVLGSQGKSIHSEVLSSPYGHDAFLKKSTLLNSRISAFIANGVSGVRRYLADVGQW